MSAMMLTVASFFIFVSLFLRPSGRSANILTFLSAPVFIIGLMILWTGDIFVTGQENLSLSSSGYLPLAVSIAYLTACFWIINSSGHKHADMLRIPILILLLAYFSHSIGPLMLSPIGTILIMAATILIGLTMLRYQIFNPFDELNSELRTANNDLQQVINDLTNEKVKVKELIHDLSEANEHRNKFLANMGHELRTPLNSIIGYSELLQEGIYGSLTEDQDDRLERIHRNGHDLLGIVTNVLDLNNLDSGELGLISSTFGLGPVIEMVVSKLEAECAKKNLKLSVEIDEALPLLTGDEARIQQILDNLLNNALKFTQQGEIDLKTFPLVVDNGLSAEFTLPMPGWLHDGEWILITMTDTGVGIAPEHQSTIFEAFSQADSSHTRQFGGAGLGLAIVKRLVEIHSGVIWVKSTLGEGSTFFVALPAVNKDNTIASN